MAKKTVTMWFPRPDAERFADLLHLNNFPCKLEACPGGPTKIIVTIPDKELVLTDSFVNLGPEKPGHRNTC